MTIDATFQVSLGRFCCALKPEDTVRQAKKKLRTDVPEVSHVNLASFHIYVNGRYITDESQTVKAAGLQSGDVLHFVKKSSCPAAAVDTEKKTDDE